MPTVTDFEYVDKVIVNPPSIPILFPVIPIISFG